MGEYCEHLEEMFGQGHLRLRYSTIRKKRLPENRGGTAGRSNTGVFFLHLAKRRAGG